MEVKLFKLTVMAVTAACWLAPVANAAGTPTVRFFKATITPLTVTAGSTGVPFSVTITNCDATVCDASHVTSLNQNFGSATVAIPTGFIVDGSSLTASASSGKFWSASISGSTIVAGAGPAAAGTMKLVPGESLTLMFNATAPCVAGGFEWTTHVYQDTLNPDGTVKVDTPYTLFGNQPVVTVPASCSVPPSGFGVGDYCSYTQGGWGAPPSGTNPGFILSLNFASVYLTGVAVGGTYTMTFTSAFAIEAYLPAGGTANALTGNLANPTSTSAGVFGGQVLALRLNVDFNDKLIIDGVDGPISSLKLIGTGGSLDGQSVAQILAAAQTALGGGALPSGYSISSLNSLVSLLNEAFDNCVPSVWAQTHLTP